MTDRDPYETAVINDAFGTPTDEEAAMLVADPRRWYETSGMIISDLCTQLSGPMREDETWVGNVRSIRKKLERRRPYVKSLYVKPAHAHYDLRGAIIAHRRELLEGGFEPEPHDLALWATAGLEST